MTKFNYPIKRGEPGFEEAVKAIQPGDTVEVVIRDSEYPPATLRGEAYSVGVYSLYLGTDVELRDHQRVDPEGEIVELVSVEKPPPPATLEELKALGHGSTVVDTNEDVWVKLGLWECATSDRSPHFIDELLKYAPIKICARAEA